MVRTATRRAVPVLMLLLSAACGGEEALAGGDAAEPTMDAMEETYRSTYHDFRVVTVAEGLVNPWSMAWLPNGDMLITERPGRLRVVREGQLLPDPVQGVPEVVANGQGGLMDVVPHPQYADNQFIYLSYSKPLDGDGSTTAVVRGRFDGSSLTELEEVYEADSRGRGHYGSRLAFDQEGYLFITIGDRQVSPQGDLESHPAQDISNNHGTINRIYDDGRVPDDNPFVGQANARPEIWSYGHRNPQGLAIDPATGIVWANEHGPQGGDELNVIQPGMNYGWPVVGHGVNYGSGSPIHESSRREGMERPAHFWVPSIATSGLLIYSGDKFPEWQGDLFIGGMAGQQVARIEVDGEDVVSEETLALGVGRVRDVRQGPDGYIYLAIEDRRGEPRRVARLEPIG